MRHDDPASGKEQWKNRQLWGLGVLFGVVGLAACVIPWTRTPPRSGDFRRVEPVAEAGNAVGSEQCSACHASFDDHHVATTYHADCETCHGAGELHVYTAGREDIRYPANEDCEGCHRVGRRTLYGWETSEHARAGILCTDCHNTHNQEPMHVRAATPIEADMLRDASPVTQMCSGCHPSVVSMLNFPSHHPVLEGMMDCTDCHRPHEGRSQSLGLRTQQCSTCHQEVTGPWVYEHPPVSEDCAYCHLPHGAGAENLLNANEPGGCINCHSLATTAAAHDPWAFATSCTDCHSAIHGSHTDPHLRN